MRVRFGSEPVESHCETLDGIFAMDDEPFVLHQNELCAEGFVLCDASLGIKDERVLSLPLVETSKALGNPKVATSVAIGAVLSLFGIASSDCKAVLSKALKPGLAGVNLTAIEKGGALAKSRYQSVPQDLTQHMLISGTNASTLGAIAAGLKFYSAYPMSPSTGILEYLSERGDEYDLITESAQVRTLMMDKRMRKQTLLETELLEPEFFGNEQ